MFIFVRQKQEKRGESFKFQNLTPRKTLLILSCRTILSVEMDTGPTSGKKMAAPALPKEGGEWDDRQ